MTVSGPFDVCALSETGFLRGAPELLVAKVLSYVRIFTYEHLDVAQNLESRTRTSRARRRRPHVRIDRAIFLCLSRLRRRRGSIAGSLWFWAGAPPHPLLCRPQTRADNRRAAGDPAHYETKSQSRASRIGGQELHRSSRGSAGSETQAAL